MSGPGRRWLVGAVLLGVLTALVAAVVSVLSLRAPGPAEVAEDYLASSWNGDWRTECDLATKEWRRADLFAGYPFADCAAFADAAEEANGEGGFLDFADDTDIDITVQTVNDDDGRARVEYLIEFRYDGSDRAGFDALWQGGGALDRGTVELVDVDGAWRVAGVDAG